MLRVQLRESTRGTPRAENFQPWGESRQVVRAPMAPRVQPPPGEQWPTPPAEIPQMAGYVYPENILSMVVAPTTGPPEVRAGECPSGAPIAQINGVQTYPAPHQSSPAYFPQPDQPSYQSPPSGAQFWSAGPAIALPPLQYPRLGRRPRHRPTPPLRRPSPGSRPRHRTTPPSGAWYHQRLPHGWDASRTHRSSAS